jgi:hypothetical protein
LLAERAAAAATAEQVQNILDSFYKENWPFIMSAAR